MFTAYNGQVAQSVEQRTENPRVGSSILSLATISSISEKYLEYYIEVLQLSVWIKDKSGVSYRPCSVALALCFMYEDAIKIVTRRLFNIVFTSLNIDVVDIFIGLIRPIILNIPEDF